MCSSFDNLRHRVVGSSHATTDPNLEPMAGLIAHERAVSIIDGQIEDLMCNVRQLQFSKLQHQEWIRHHKGMITLARRIPPEILAIIFEECVLDGWTRTPLTVSHVCSEWRKAASIPTVWSHVYVNCDARDPCGRTKFWLQKAQNSFIHVTMDVRNDASHLSGVMELLLGRMPYWRTFTINSALLWHSNYILSFCNLPSPELRAINISIIQEFDDLDDQLDVVNERELVGLMDSFHQAPQLLTLRISRNIIPSHGTLPPSITNLSITLPCYHVKAKSSVNEVLSLLEGLPLLQHFSMSVTPGQAREFEPIPDGTRFVNIPELRTLVLIGSPDIFGVLPHLFTPALTSLHLRSSLDPLGYPDEQTGFHICRFIERASPPLELFELHDIDLSPNDFSACFLRLPYLRELRLHESEISDAVIQQFNGPEWFCPLLSRLDFRWCGQVTGRALVELVQCRFANNQDKINDTQLVINPITAITAINCSFVNEQDIVDLAQTTVCQVVMQANDYCRQFGCCQNERYRRRLRLRRRLHLGGSFRSEHAGLVL